MKKIITLALAALGVAFIGTACKSTETNRPGDHVQITMPLTLDPQVEIGTKKITGSAAVHSILGFINWGVSDQAVGAKFGTGVAADMLSFIPSGENVAKNGAVYNACVTNNADLIIAPQYILKTENYFVYKVIKCNVTGFPGTIKSVKVIPAK